MTIKEYGTFESKARKYFKKNLQPTSIIIYLTFLKSL